MIQTFRAQGIAKSPASTATFLSGHIARLEPLGDDVSALDPQLVIPVAPGSFDHAARHLPKFTGTV